MSDSSRPFTPRRGEDEEIWQEFIITPAVENHCEEWRP